MDVPIIGRHRIAIEATDVPNLFSVQCECGWRTAAPFGEHQATKAADEHLDKMGQRNVPRVFV